MNTITTDINVLTAASLTRSLVLDASAHVEDSRQRAEPLRAHEFISAPQTYELEGELVRVAPWVGRFYLVNLVSGGAAHCRRPALVEKPSSCTAPERTSR